MLRTPSLSAAIAVALGSACAPYYQPASGSMPDDQQAYVVTPTSAMQAPAPPRGYGCMFDVLQIVPSRPYVELGSLTSTGVLANSDQEFRMKASSAICGAGGDAVVVRLDSSGDYVTGAVIQYVQPGAPLPGGGTYTGP